MTQQDEATRARLSKRAVSMETRRFAAIRLAATSTSLSQVVLKFRYRGMSKMGENDIYSNHSVL